ESVRGGVVRGMGCPCLNLHFSLLPRHRGAAPIAWAILSGDAEAGATLHHMEEAIDAGDVLAQRAVPIGPETTARELYERVSAAASGLFADCYPFDAALLAARRPQAAGAPPTRRSGDLDFSRRRVDFAREAGELQRWLRAWIFPPFQLPETGLGGRRLAIARVGADVGEARGAVPGTVLARGDGAPRGAGRGGPPRLPPPAAPRRPAAPSAAPR